MKPDATIWVSGTSHIIHIVGCCLEELGFKTLNDITWVKPNPPPNLSCRYFTHATETILWARRDPKRPHTFNYRLMKRLNGGKQMKSVWTIQPPRRDEKVFGKHPTQKPLALLERIIAASTNENALVLDPFSGSGTTGIAAARLRRSFVGLELANGFLDMGVRRFVGIPQADNPDRILAMVAQHLHSAPSRSDLSRTLRITKRQVHYYRQAASLLGLLQQQGGRWQVTPAGQTLCAQNPQARGLELARAILRNPLVKAVLAGICRRRTPASRRCVVADFLERCSALNASTCQRRARTLLAWISWAQSRVEGYRGDLFGDVPSTSEETEDAAIA